MTIALHRPFVRSAALLGALFAGIPVLAAPAQASGCPPICITSNSVKNAAGIDPKLLSALAFKRGEAAMSAGSPSVARVAQAWKAGGGKGVVGLRVSADAGLSGAAASAQTKARAAALTQALIGAGIPAKQVQVVAR